MTSVMNVKTNKQWVVRRKHLHVLLHFYLYQAKFLTLSFYQQFKLNLLNTRKLKMRKKLRILANLANLKIQVLFEMASNLENLRNVRVREYVIILDPDPGFLGQIYFGLN